jgi:hypothetical protein
MNVQDCITDKSHCDSAQCTYPMIGLYTIQPTDMCCGPFTKGVAECVQWSLFPGINWCLVSIPIKDWSFNGTICPLPLMIREQHIIDCVGMRTIFQSLCNTLTQPMSKLANTEEVGRGNIATEHERQIQTMRWLHIIHLGVVMAGKRWCCLVLATEPLPRCIRSHRLQVSKQACILTADGNIAARRLLTDGSSRWTHRSPAYVQFLPRAVQMTMGGEALQYIGWLSDIVRALVEECTIFVITEHRTMEHPATKFACLQDTMLPHAQREWLETWEAADRLASLEESWMAWVRQCSAIRNAFRNVTYHWEQFHFTVQYYGFERLALFEQARIGGVLQWAIASIERIQLITLHAVGHLTPQLGAPNRATFCKHISLALLELCGR